MKSKYLSQKYTPSSPEDFLNAAITQNRKPYEFDPSKLRLPASVSIYRRSKITNCSRYFFDLLTRTGLNFCDEKSDTLFDLSNESDAREMLLVEQSTLSRKTEPQIAASALIIADVARQAAIFKQSFCFATTRKPTFEQVLLGMDEIASAVGPLAGCNRFSMDVEIAAEGVKEFFGSDCENLFSSNGEIDQAALKYHAKRITAIASKSPVKVLKFVNSIHASTIASMVATTGLFDFAVGAIDVTDSVFMKHLAKHLVRQRENELTAL
jgi:hypothetical protein